MKKITIALLLALLFVGLFVSCSSDINNQYVARVTFKGIGEDKLDGTYYVKNPSATKYSMDTQSGANLLYEDKACTEESTYCVIFNYDSENKITMAQIVKYVTKGSKSMLFNGSLTTTEIVYKDGYIEIPEGVYAFTEETAVVTFEFIDDAKFVAIQYGDN